MNPFKKKDSAPDAAAPPGGVPDARLLPRGARAPQGEFYQVSLRWSATLSRLLLLSVVGNACLALALAMQARRFQPAVQLVDTQTNKVVVVPNKEEVKVGDLQYSPVQVQDLARRFVLLRYGYAPLELEANLSAALSLMDPAARQAEEAAVRDNRVVDYIVSTGATYAITLDESSWQTNVIGDNQLEVRVKGSVSIRNNTQYRDTPLTRSAEFVLRLRKDPQTRENPLGLTVVAPSKEIL